MLQSNGFVTLAIPAADLRNKNLGRIMTASLGYSSSRNGKGSVTRIENIHDVGSELKQSLLATKHVAQRLTVKSFSQDTTLYFRERQHAIEENSWQIMLALGFTSLLTGIQLKNGITGSGGVKENGDIGRIGGLNQKISAARRTGLSTFLVAESQASEESIDTTGTNIIPVINLRQPFLLATGLAPWQVISNYIADKTNTEA